MLDMAGEDLLEPPSDPDDWTDEQWIEWLKATDDPTSEDPVRGSRRRRSKTPGGALGAAMLGLRDAIYGHPDEVTVVVDSSGDPPDGDRPQVLLDPDHPEMSRVVIRRRAGTEGTPAGEDTPAGTEGTTADEEPG
jgi:hypothetical protein